MEKVEGDPHADIKKKKAEVNEMKESLGSMDEDPQAEIGKKAKTTLPKSSTAAANAENMENTGANPHEDIRRKTKNTQPDKEKEKLSPTLYELLIKESMKRFDQKERLKEQKQTPSTSSGSQALSTNDIMRMARLRLLQHSPRNLDVVSILFRVSFAANSGYGMSSEADEDVELAQFLHACALNVHTRQFVHAKKFLNLCKSSSASRNPVQKVVFFFAEALQKRINKELGILLSSENQMNETSVEENMMNMNFHPAAIEQTEKEIPFCRIAEFTAIQFILDNVASDKRVHLVDLGIRSGSRWPVLMQGLRALADESESPLEMLKITAIGTSKEGMEEIGKHLSSFAETMKIPFQFKILVSELHNLEENMIEIEADEAVAVFSELRLASLLPWPDRLERLLKSIANVHPRTLVTIEFDANTNSSDFIERFNEGLTLASAALDCIDSCMDRENPCRTVIENVVIREMIDNIITAEGEERVHGQLRHGMWREVIARSGLVELPMSDYALCQAKMLVTNNPRWSGCSLDTDGKCMIVGWRGNPIKSVSAWTFGHAG